MKFKNFKERVLYFMLLVIFNLLLVNGISVW